MSQKSVRISRRIEKIFKFSRICDGLDVTSRRSRISGTSASVSVLSVEQSVVVSGTAFAGNGIFTRIFARARIKKSRKSTRQQQRDCDDSSRRRKPYSAFCGIVCHNFLFPYPAAAPLSAAIIYALMNSDVTLTVTVAPIISSGRSSSVTLNLIASIRLPVLPASGDSNV